MFMVLDQFRVSWKAPDVPAEASARPLADGSLLVTKDLTSPNDIVRLVSILLANGYENITVEKVYNGPISFMEE